MDGRGTGSTVPELVDSWPELDVMVEVELHMKDRWKEMGEVVELHMKDSRKKVVVGLHMKDNQRAAKVVREDGMDVDILRNSSKELVKARLH